MISGSKEIFAMTGEVRQFLPDLGPFSVTTSNSVHHLMPELFGYTLMPPAKPRVSLPYLERLIQFGKENENSDMNELAQAFAVTPAAHEAVQSTLTAYQERLEVILHMYPEGQLTLAQGGMALGVATQSLKSILERSSVPLFKEMIQTGRGRRSTDMVPVDQLGNIFEWHYPESYPEELIPTPPEQSA